MRYPCFFDGLRMDVSLCVAAENHQASYTWQAKEAHVYCTCWHKDRVLVRSRIEHEIRDTWPSL